MKLLLRIGIATIAAAAAVAQTEPLWQRIAERLTANALKADVSFLASDALEGRATPSKGLDVAAEYVAAQFRRAGLEPVGDDGYFQTAPYATVTPNAEGLEFTLETASGTLRADKATMSIQEGAALDLRHAAAFKLSAADTAAIDALTPETVKGKVLLVEVPDASSQPAGGRGGRGGFAANRRLLQAAAKAQPALVVMLRAAAVAPASPNPQLKEVPSSAVAMLTVADAALRAAVAEMKAGPVEATVSARMAAPTAVPVKLRNVAGLLRGSDPALRDTYLLLTAHYDHLGVRGGRVYYGANDDASGTASVLEIAGALASLPSHPKRGIVFLALFGEERGELGSQYYARHPIFPLAKTVADINLEQLGRTDETGEAPKLAQFNLTGFDFTDLAAIFRECGGQAGVRAVKDEARSDAYFGRSDNAAFANAGVPSTTLSVTYEFSDYHAAGDAWPKLDYENMATVDRAVALAAYRIADSAEEPRWNAENPRTEAYRKARAK